MDGKECSCELEFWEIYTAILMDISTVNLAHSWTDGTDNGHTLLIDRQTSRGNHILIDRQMSHLTDMWIHLSCYGQYDRWTHLGIHLNQTCDVSTKVLVVV